jgi:uncharacterized protein (DUF2342 family)
MISTRILGAAALAAMLSGCLAPKLDRTRRAVSDAIVLSREAEPRVDECARSVAATNDDDLIRLCDPIISEFDRLRERQRALREAVERIDAEHDPINGSSLYRELKMLELTEELEATTRGFRQTLSDLPKLKGAPAE